MTELEKTIKYTKNLLVSPEIQQLPEETQKIDKSSKSAILLKVIKPEISLFKIQEKLNTELNKYEEHPIINTKISRKNNLLIINSTTEDETDALLKFIETMEDIKDQVEITIKSEDLRKIILLGIPRTKTQSQVISQIKQKHPNST